MQQEEDIKVISFDFDGTLVTLELEEEFWEKEIPRLYAKQHNVSIAEANKVWSKTMNGVKDDQIE